MATEALAFTIQAQGLGGLESWAEDGDPGKTPPSNNPGEIPSLQGAAEQDSPSWARSCCDTQLVPSVQA